jgi:hypothetical protein
LVWGGEGGKRKLERISEKKIDEKK